MAKTFLESLKIDDIIYVPFENNIEELKVVREVTGKTRYIAVLVKRPHLQRIFALTAEGAKVGFMWHSSRKTFHDYQNWNISRVVAGRG